MVAIDFSGINKLAKDLHTKRDNMSQNVSLYIKLEGLL